MIQLDKINKYYKTGAETLRVLNDITLNIEQGDYISIMGPSGSGKSTLLNMLGLLDVFDTGSYRLEGVQTEVLDEEQRARIRGENIGFIFQSFQLIDRLTAAENVELPLILDEQSPKERKQKVAHVLAQVGLSDRATHRPGQMSGGQLQRVAIARAIVMQPQLILADEPTGNLDQKSGKEIVALLEELNRKGLTVVVVTHDLALGKRAKRRCVMVDGELSETPMGDDTAYESIVMGF
ncbi:ABC transporter ATP-binding protein [Alteromonas sp. a30]|uniref:ABC transporter ATP-binding protein n=1 Tax=Alteromonas sp. a30 TaxID=2730917 RepID=UPI002281D08E|nr:ABC transporter ATP-binding protein [Alteromonas sp. a30]MCY7294961.1 ABC transporter ATP-binding protein [Alteromonas sp. a30]